MAASERNVSSGLPKKKKNLNNAEPLVGCDTFNHLLLSWESSSGLHTISPDSLLETRREKKNPARSFSPNFFHPPSLPLLPPLPVQSFNYLKERKFCFHIQNFLVSPCRSW